MIQHREVGKRKTIVIIAEGAHDKHLNPISAEHVRDVLTDRLGLDTRVTTLGHIQRGGRPCALDRVLVCMQTQFLIHQFTMLCFAAHVAGCQGCGYSPRSNA